MGIDASCVGPGFAREVRGLDLRTTPAISIESTIWSMLDESLLVVVRDQEMSLINLIELTTALGRPEMAWEAYARHPDEPRIHVISSERTTSVPYLTSSQHWHTDRSFVACPSHLTILYAAAAPSSGGGTEFADTRSAHDQLGDDVRQRLAGLSGNHSYSYRFHALTARRTSVAVADMIAAEFPDVCHPIIRTHPRTARRSLYINELCLSSIRGLGSEESSVLLATLYEHALQDRFIYRHKWKKGDVLIWDNPSLLHRNSGEAFEGKRILLRTSIEGPRPE